MKHNSFYAHPNFYVENPSVALFFSECSMKWLMGEEKGERDEDGSGGGGWVG